MSMRSVLAGPVQVHGAEQDNGCVARSPYRDQDGGPRAPRFAPRTPGTNEEWRVTVEEWELLPADFELGGTGGWQPRIVYADHLPI